jgi:hypothetical protein
MSKKAYWDSYIRFEKSILHERHLDPPDYDAALKGKR